MLSVQGTRAKEKTKVFRDFVNLVDFDFLLNLFAIQMSSFSYMILLKKY